MCISILNLNSQELLSLALPLLYLGCPLWMAVGFIYLTEAWEHLLLNT